MLEPVISRIEVPCSQQQAFEIFMEMGSWWPLHKRSMSLKNGQPAKCLNVDAQMGGKIVEIGHDDAEYHWGTFKTLAPHSLITMDFHMGMPADKASLVEVRFTLLGENRTEVVLTQSNWEAFGDMAEMLRGGYGSSWGLIFEEAYGNACMARAVY
jgi:hypothetical protein